MNQQAAIVTGGHSGMGFAAAKLLIEKNARVTIIGRRAERVMAQAQEIGALGIVCDVADSSAVEAAIVQAEKANGVARCLIHAAADGASLTLLQPDGQGSAISAFQDMVATNVLGTLFVDRAFAARLVRAEPLDSGLRGIIINVSSISAADGFVGSVYAATKGCSDAFTISLARELGAWGIRACTIIPGGVDTEMLRAGAGAQTDAATYAAMAKSIVPGLGRWGRPEEFAALALHLCENEYLNGVNIRFDGGCRLPFIAQQDKGG